MDLLSLAAVASALALASAAAIVRAGGRRRRPASFWCEVCEQEHRYDPRDTEMR